MGTSGPGGPHIRQAWLPHLALAWRDASGRTLAIRHSDTVAVLEPSGLRYGLVTEPYSRTPGTSMQRSSSPREWASALSSGDVVSIALLYVGPGSVVDLASLTTTLFGGPPQL